jgi:hypothetical protein
VTGDEARDEGGATATVSASMAPMVDVTGAASGAMAVAPPTALASPSASGLRALRVFFFF